MKKKSKILKNEETKLTQTKKIELRGDHKMIKK